MPKKNRFVALQDPPVLGHAGVLGDLLESYKDEIENVRLGYNVRHKGLAISIIL